MMVWLSVGSSVYLWDSAFGRQLVNNWCLLTKCLMSPRRNRCWINVAPFTCFLSVLLRSPSFLFFSLSLSFLFSFYFFYSIFLALFRLRISRLFLKTQEFLFQSIFSFVSFYFYVAYKDKCCLCSSNGDTYLQIIRCSRIIWSDVFFNYYPNTRTFLQAYWNSEASASWFRDNLVDKFREYTTHKSTFSFWSEQFKCISYSILPLDWGNILLSPDISFSSFEHDVAVHSGVRYCLRFH